MTDETPMDGYLAKLPDDQRELLERVHARVRQLAPDAVESMSYGMPVFQRGRPRPDLVRGVEGALRHLPLTDAFLAEHADELAAFRQTKGSVHFTPEAPLPDSLLERMVRARLADLEAEA